MDIAGSALLPGAWPILRSALQPVLERLKERLGGQDPVSAPERAAAELEADPRLQELLRTGLLKALDPVLAGQQRIERDTQLLCLFAMGNSRKLDEVAERVGDIQTQLESGMSLTPEAAEALSVSVADRIRHVLETQALVSGPAAESGPSTQPAWLGRDEIKRRVQSLQTDALVQLESGRTAEALMTLERARGLLDPALAETPTDFRLRLLSGYLAKDLAQAAGAAGDLAAAAAYLDRAESLFALLTSDMPTEPAAAAGALNGLGNVRQMRGDLRDAIKLYRRATEMLPTYAYAWQDMFLAYDELAARGELDIAGLEDAFANLDATATGVPALEPVQLEELRARLEAWRGRR